MVEVRGTGVLPSEVVLPKRIGRYEILGQLAAGGMAEILLARLYGPADFKRAVVIKRILRSYATNASFVRMFLDEARVVASLRHPNVVHVQELGEHDDDPFLVMEYVAGENASSLLKRTTTAGEPLDPRLAAHLVAEACAGLHAAHELEGDDGKKQNLVHRDVSPQNVLVGYDGHVKLVDFGVVLVDRRSSRTEPGEVKGKFDYMSPEQMLGKPLDRRSDIFSLGIVLYELATGRRLFKRASHAKTIDAICKEPVVPPSRVVSPVASPEGAPFPKRLDEIVLRALSKEPGDRYATAADMRKDLLEVARELPSPVEALADRMRALFADRIAEKQEMLRHVSEGSQVFHVPAGETDEDVDVPSAPDHTVIDAHVAPLVASGPQLYSSPPPSSTAPRSTALALVAGLALVAVFALGLGWQLRSSGASSPPPPHDEDIEVSAAPEDAPGSPLSTADPSAQTAGPATESDAGTAPQESSSVMVHVDTKPTGARVRVDDIEMGATPVALRLPKGTTPVRLEVRRPGFVTVSQTVTPDADQKLFVALSTASVSPSTARGGRPGKSPASAATSPPSTSSTGFRRFD
jgi:serine/threonine-protein kinase